MGCIQVQACLSKWHAMMAADLLYSMGLTHACIQLVQQSTTLAVQGGCINRCAANVYDTMLQKQEGRRAAVTGTCIARDLQAVSMH